MNTSLSERVGQIGEQTLRETMEWMQIEAVTCLVLGLVILLGTGVALRWVLRRVTRGCTVEDGERTVVRIASWLIAGLAGLAGAGLVSNAINIWMWPTASAVRRILN